MQYPSLVYVIIHRLQKFALSDSTVIMIENLKRDL